jgi:hypothetical protein
MTMGTPFYLTLVVVLVGIIVNILVLLRLAYRLEGRIDRLEDRLHNDDEALIGKILEVDALVSWQER